MNETTAPMKSKTILTNGLILSLVQIATAFGWEPSQETVAAMLSLIPFLNILLRMVTKNKLG